MITEAAASSPNVKALVFVDADAPEVGETASTLKGDGSVVLTLAEDELFGKVPVPEAPDGFGSVIEAGRVPPQLRE